MKKNTIISVIVITLGLLIAVGPQFLFKVCIVHDDAVPHCHWSAQAEIGMGIIIVSLGICFLLFTDPKTHLGLIIGVFFASLIALCVPHVLIGGCSMMTMQCRKAAFPALTAESVILLIFSAVMLTIIALKTPPVEVNANA